MVGGETAATRPFHQHIMFATSRFLLFFIYIFLEREREMGENMHRGGGIREGENGA